MLLAQRTLADDERTAFIVAHNNNRRIAQLANGARRVWIVRACNERESVCVCERAHSMELI